ncbi:sigma-54-dependent transcriptional regulator [Methylocystis parvus]|uniref:Sigma-54-dependent Fis family transcriptional regulator n=1 Tax=Methylocystis parvus TaxID=134 RepID=A0A6B8MAQ9_9HYPH|nr:sigma-54 dependent transcriptional regulator [Methylocystis parvus]QGM97740.1 sigma-54-dependent Fis family transcriptional regulator [Methylocystis parvus]WBK01957.1 sigma-54 dependent transcriptional regulator [Methylocystis parvus OBBP]
MTGETILIVDDEAAFLRLAGGFLTRQGYRVVTAQDAASARKAYDAERPDLVLLDLVMPPERTPEAGLSALPHFEKSVVIVMTAHSDHELALRAVGLGAWDFLAKPVEPELLKFSVARALAKRSLERDLAQLRAQDDAEYGLVGSGPAMTRLKEMIRRIGAAELPTMILGPTGSGKELVAKALHKASARRDRPLVSIHCGAIPAELIESELFGHLKGSFTGAHADRAGLVAAANGGTLFLDEVGETPAPMQVKLLRFLQEGSYTPVGARDMRRADVRVICATHRDLEAMIAAGSFREDLYYRLRGVIIRTPALDERREDIPLLAAHLLGAAARKRRLKLSHEALVWLAAQSWPGNVRELRATIECAAALADPATASISVDDLAFARDGGASPIPAVDALEEFLPEATERLERRMIGAALAATDNNHSAAARRLGLSRVGLLKMMTRLGLR